MVTTFFLYRCKNCVTVVLVDSPFTDGAYHTLYSQKKNMCVLDINVILICMIHSWAQSYVDIFLVEKM